MCRTGTPLDATRGVDGLPRNYALAEAVGEQLEGDNNNRSLGGKAPTMSADSKPCPLHPSMPQCALCLDCKVMLCRVCLEGPVHAKHRMADITKSLVEFEAAAAPELDFMRKEAHLAKADAAKEVATALENVEAQHAAYMKAREAASDALVRCSNVTWQADRVLKVTTIAEMVTLLLPSSAMLPSSTPAVSTQTFRGILMRTIGNGRGMGQFSYPSGVCALPDGHTIVVSDTDMHKLQVVSVTDGVFLRTMGSIRGNGPHSFNYPVSVSRGNNKGRREVIVCDSYNHRLSFVDADRGVFVRTISCGTMSPYGVCELSEELLAVSDAKINKVALLQRSDGSIVRVLDKLGLSGPTALCCVASRFSPTEKNLLAICDTKNHRVLVVDEEGVVVRTHGSLHQPQGVCQLLDGSLVISDSGHHRVIIVAPDGTTISRVLGGSSSQGVGEGQFDSPRGVCCLQDGHSIAVCDFANARVVIYS